MSDPSSLEQQLRASVNSPVYNAFSARGLTVIKHVALGGGLSRIHSTRFASSQDLISEILLNA